MFRALLDRLPEYGLVLLLRGLSRFLAILPLRWALAVGRGIGLLADVFVGTGLASRIDRYFPGQGRRIARGHLIHVATTICEFLRVPYRPDDLKHIEMRGVEHAPRDGGVLLVSHYGNFELAGRVATRIFPKIADIARVEESPFWRFVDQMRAGSGIRFIRSTLAAPSRARAYRDAARLLKQGFVVVFHCDFPERMGGGGVEMEFLGQKKPFFEGGVLLAQRLQKPTLAAFMTRLPQGHLVEVLPLPARDPLPAFVRELEDRVRARPEQYQWL